MKLFVAERQPGTAVVGIAVANLDASNVKAFKDAIEPVLGSHRRVLIDMANLRFVDSSGLGALLSCLRIMNSAGNQLALFGMQKPVRALFELVRMHRVFGIYDSAEDALAALWSVARHEPEVGADARDRATPGLGLGTVQRSRVASAAA